MESKNNNHTDCQLFVKVFFLYFFSIIVSLVSFPCVLRLCCVYHSVTQKEYSRKGLFVFSPSWGNHLQQSIEQTNVLDFSKSAQTLLIYSKYEITK